MKLPIKYSLASSSERRAVREEYVKVQNGLCYHCKGNLSEPPLDDRDINLRRFPTNFLKYPVHLHHDHDTDLTLGAVHAKCNGILWQYYGE